MKRAAGTCIVLIRIRGLSLFLMAVVLMFTTTVTRATTYTISYVWSSASDPNVNKLAGQCSYTYPDNQPFSVPRSVVADNSVPAGTILASWSYADLNVPLSVSCSGSGIEGTTPLVSSSYGGIIANSSSLTVMGYNIAGSLVDSGILNTTVPGIGIRFYVQSDTPDLGNGIDTPAYIRLAGFGDSSGSAVFAASGVEYPYAGPTVGQAALAMSMLRSRTENGTTLWYIPTRSLSISLRAELIKTGYVENYGPVSFSHLFNSWITPSPSGSASVVLPPSIHFLTGTGVTLVRPTCKLSSQRPTDYSVNMGTWDAYTISREGAPAFGPDVPVPVELECNGMAENIRMRFEDAGASPLPVSNIGLYDAAGGHKIDGLEIELRYNGNHIDVNGSAVNIGSYGSGATSVGGDKMFAVPSTSFVPITFQARYIQRAMITRSAVNYTGPVSGTVNLFMVYD